MIKEYTDSLVTSLQNLPQDEILKAASLIANMKLENKVMVCGNGGDAALANHFVVDLMKFADVPAISLCANQSMLTMIGNDYEYEDIFVVQLGRIFNDGDILFCLSTSGTSRNIVLAAEYAKSLCKFRDFKVISLVGYKGCLERISDITIEIPHLSGPMPIEDVQSAICHMITQEVMRIKGISQ